MKDSPTYLIQTPFSYMILTEQLVIMLTALSDFKRLKYEYCPTHIAVISSESIAVFSCYFCAA